MNLIIRKLAMYDKSISQTEMLKNTKEYTNNPINEKLKQNIKELLNKIEYSYLA